MRQLTYLASIVLIGCTTHAHATTVSPIETKVTAADAALGDYFGLSVALSGTTTIVGAYADDDAGSDSGSAYLFDTTTGNQIAKLTADDAAGGDRFGYSVALSGTTAIVGAYGDDDAGSHSGSAYLFDTTTNNQIAKLTAADAAGSDFFGYSVAISGTTAIVGAYQDDDAGSTSGSAYLYSGVAAPAPVPLPAGVWMLAAALGLIGGMRRLQRSRAA